MITERRMFQGKVGTAGGIVAKIKELIPMVQQAGGTNPRVYTDFYSGHTDRVVWETDYKGVAQIEEMLTTVNRNRTQRRAFEAWFESLKPLIEGATVELWAPVSLAAPRPRRRARRG